MIKQSDVSMIQFCPYCEQETEQVLVNEHQDFCVREETISVPVSYYHCNVCGGDYEPPQTEEDDPFNLAYRAYRTRNGLLQPEEIRAHRNKLGLTQKEFSALLGIGIATINRYENGALQTEAHDNIIRMMMDPKNLVNTLERKPALISEGTREQLLSKLGTDIYHQNELLYLAIKKYGNYSPGIYSGNKNFDFDKFTQVCKFFCYQSEVYKTKLVKLLFYADFLHFKENQVSITGCQYIHLDLGPVPDQYETWLLALSSWLGEIIKTEKSYGGYGGEVFTSQNHPIIEVFTRSELVVLATVKEKFSNISAKKISDLSHKEKAFTETHQKAFIPYSYASDLQI